MGKRLKQIKHKSDIDGFEKQVVYPLIKDSQKFQKEEKHEQMRCKVEIFEGTLKPILSDSFVVNTNSLRDTVEDIVNKLGSNTQFIITNLFDEKIVVRRFTHRGGYDKEKDDKEHFNQQMETIRKIHKLKSENVPLEEIGSKISYIVSKSRILEIYNSTEDIEKQKLRDLYGNQYLGISSKELNTNKSINIQ